MKICVISSVYALSETDPHASFLVEAHRHLRKRGVEVTVLAPSYKGLATHVVDSVRVVRFRYFFRRFEDLTHGQGAPNRIRNPLYLALAAVYIVAGQIAVLRLCHREKFDLVHVHWPFPHGIWTTILNVANPVPTVYTFHGAELLLSQRFKLVGAIMRWLLPQADAIVCNSTFTADKALSLGANHIHVIPFGATIEPAERTGRAAGRRALFVGRLIERKGLPILIEAISLLRKTVDCTLDVVGDGPERHACERRAQELGIAQYVTFHGIVSREQLHRLYAESTVFVLPAIVDRRGDTEGLGVVLVEAMQFGLPVVASEVGGIPDVIVSGKAGLLVPPGCPGPLASAIESIMNNRDFAAKLTAAALVHASTYFNWDRIADETLQVYAEAVDAKNSQPESPSKRAAH